MELHWLVLSVVVLDLAAFLFAADSRPGLQHTAHPTLRHPVPSSLRRPVRSGPSRSVGSGTRRPIRG